MDQTRLEEGPMLDQVDIAYALHELKIHPTTGIETLRILSCNERFAQLTDTPKDQIPGKCIDELLSARDAGDESWLSLFQEAMEQRTPVAFERHVHSSDRHFRILIHQLAPHLFTTLFEEITDRYLMVDLSRHLLEVTDLSFDYITEQIRRLSGARYAAFNQFERDGAHFSTRALAGSTEHLRRISSLLGIPLVGRRWEHDPYRLELLKREGLVVLPTLEDLSNGELSRHTMAVVAKTLGIGSVALLRVAIHGDILGDFTLLFGRDVVLKNQRLIMTLTSEIALRLEIDRKHDRLEKSRERYASLASEAPVGIAVIDTIGQIRYLNQKFMGILTAYDPKAGIPDNLIHYPPFVKEGLADALQHTMTSQETTIQEFSYPSAEKRILYLRVHVSAELLENRVTGARLIVDDLTDRYEAEKRLLASENNFRHFFENSRDLVVVSDLSGYILKSNDTAIDRLGYSAEELETMQLIDLHPPSAHTEAEALIDHLLAGERDTCPLPLITAQGYTLPAEIQAWRGQWSDEECLFIVAKDLSSEQAALQKFNRFFENNPALMTVSLLPEGKITEANASFYEKTGFTPDEIIGHATKDLALFAGDQTDEIIHSRLASSEAIHHLPVRLRTKEGDLLEGLYSAERIDSQGESLLLSVFVDITELKESQAAITHLSYHDQLTGLYNRRFFEEEMARLNTARSYPLSLMMIDVNGLKLINDAFGHKHGDDMLIAVADTLRDECRADEIISRISGDEFVLLLPKTPPAGAAHIASRIKERLLEINVLGLPISVAIGHATKRDAELELIALFNRAEEAMYQDKLAHGSSHRYRTVGFILATLYRKHPEEKAHAKRVGRLAQEFALYLGLHREHAELLQMAGTVHDIGKIILPAEILDKKTALTPEEKRLMHRHPEVGYQILRSVDHYAPLAPIVLTHHERWDGTGYPGKSSGEQIPKDARILMICEVYDKITHERFDMPPMTEEEALAFLAEGAGGHFDPELVTAFIRWKQEDTPE